VRVRLSCAATIVVAALMIGASEANAASPATCLGLACESPDSPNHVPEAAAPASSVWAPSEWETRPSGFYEFGGHVFPGQRGVAYLVRRGELAAAPASVRGLPVVKDMGAYDFESGDVVIFGPTASLYIPSAEAVAASTARRHASRKARKHRRRTIAIANTAAADPYGCDLYYFCIYEDVEWEDRRLQFHDKGIWQNLTDWSFNDEADSYRNRRNNDSLLAEHTNGGGDRHCYDSQTAKASLQSGAFGFGDDASSTYNYKADNHC